MFFEPNEFDEMELPLVVGHFDKWDRAEVLGKRVPAIFSLARRAVEDETLLPIVIEVINRETNRNGKPSIGPITVSQLGILSLRVLGSHSDNIKQAIQQTVQY
jgi:hypothetical protein